MCSHEIITWEVANNSVTDRMINISLTHKFRPLRKIRKRTKVLNVEIKKRYGVRNYKHYIKLKTNVLRNLANDNDTGDSSSLSDVDYDIIYNSPLKQARYVAKNSEKYIFTSEEDCKDYEKKNDQRQMKNRSTERRIETRKSLRIKYAMVSTKCIDVGWREVVNKSSRIPYLQKQVCTNILDNEGNILKSNNYNHFMTQSNQQSLSSQFSSRSSTASRIMKYGDEFMTQNHGEFNVMDNKLSLGNNSENTISSKIKPTSKRKVQNHKNHSATINESNVKFNSHNSRSSLSQSTSLENGNNFDNESRTLVNSEDNNSDKLPLIDNDIPINTKNCEDMCVNHKSELLKNARRNLIPTLEKTNSMNDKDIESDKKIEDKLNCDQLLPDAISFNQYNTPLTKTNVSKIKDLSPNISSLDQQKDSGIDEDSQDKFVKIKEFNKIPTSRNMEENAKKISIFSPELKKTDEVIETVDCKEDEKNVHLKFGNDTLIDQISKENKEFSSEEEVKNSPQLNQIDINVKTNQKNEDEDLTKIEDSNDIQKQQLLFSKKNHIKDTQPKCYNISDEDKEQTNEEEKEMNSSHISKAGMDAKMHLINQKDENCVELKSTHDLQKQQILPKITYTEIFNKKYKIIDKKDNDVKNNIEKIDNGNNMDIANKYTLIKKNTLIHHSDVTDYNTDNWQEAAINAEDIDTSVTLETDNEDINVNYVSPQTKKRLQQQARLNLVVDSDSNESDNGYITKTSQKYIDNSDTNRCNADDRLKIDETNCVSKQTDISHGKDILNEVTLVLTEKLHSTNMKEGIREKVESLIKYTYENNDLFQSTTNNNPLKETQYCENVHNDRIKDDNVELTISESNILCNNEESNQFERQCPLLNKKTVRTKSNKNEEIIRNEMKAEIMHKFEYEQSTQASIKSPLNVSLNISCQYRPCNLQELVEDQKLLVETIPASFTLADLSEDEEVFILNVPSKVIQSNLQSQVLTLKKKSIKFNENRYRIVRKEVGTTSCIFATGKERKPYKIINIKNISTITVREKLPHESRKTNVSNSYIVSPVSKPLKRKQSTSR